MGVGKRTVAQDLATEFLGNTDDVRHRIAAGTHGDYHLVTRQLVRHHDRTGKSKAINFTIDVVREEIVKPSNRASVEGQGKVFVIEEAETMNPAAQNALLKTLEEPYGRTLIVLLTTTPMRLLPTIRSRTQTMTFGELSRDETRQVLSQQGVPEVDADAAFRVAGGSPGRCLQFLEDGIIERHAEAVRRLRAGEPMADFLIAAADAAGEAALKRDPLGSKDAFTRDGFRLWLGLAADALSGTLADAPNLRTCQRIEALHLCEKYLSANVNKELALRQLDLSLFGA